MTAAAMAEIDRQARLAAAAWHIYEAKKDTGFSDRAFAAWLRRIAKDLESCCDDG